MTYPLIEEIPDWQFYCGNISEYSEHWFFSRELTCGSLTKERFRKILGLSKQSRFFVEEINWRRNYFEIRLSDRYTKELFIIATMKYKASQQELYEKYRYFILQNNFVILFKKDKLKKYIRKILLTFYDNLNKVIPADLFNIVYSDANEFICQSRQITTLNKNVISRPEYYKWGNEKMSYTFMLNYVLLEQRFGEIGFKENKNHIRIKCGDIECYNRHHPFFISESAPLIFNTYRIYPTFMENVHRYYDNQRKKKTKDTSLFQQIMLCKGIIEFREEEVIFGSDAKVFNILEGIFKISQKKDISLSIVDTCINKIIGSDLSSFITKIKKRNKSLKIVYEQHHNSPEEKKFIRREYGALIRDILKTRKNNKIDKRTINLIGFEDDYSTRELIGILDKFFEIKVSTILFPEVDLTTLKYFFRARLHVLNHFEFYRDIYNDVIFKNINNLDSLVLPPPYGLRQTVQWFKSITEFLGISIDKNTEWNRYYNEKMLEWKKLNQEANKFRLGLIVSDEDINSLVEPSKYIIGIPLLECLEEMGFGLNILVTSRENFDRQKKLLLGLFKDKKKHNIELLNNPEKLGEWISAGDSNCIYSDFRDDMRTILNGRYSFSLFLFEKGFEGAIRTLKELLRFCKVTYFSKYQDYNSIAQPLIIE